MEYNEYQNWREKHFIPSVFSNNGRKTFLNNHWNEFQGLFFNQGFTISEVNLNEWLLYQSDKVKEWFNINPKMVKFYYAECKVCELIRNKKYIVQTVNNADKRRNELINKATEAEIEVKKILDENKISYKFQEIIYIKDEFGIIRNYYIADFLINNTVIEIDGGYHLRKKQIVKDMLRTHELEKMGYQVIRIKNEDIKQIYNILGTL